ncbi:MAG: adenylate kinase [Clostridia bacterium]|nr:adenylate kinase [Clostridia bacterium]
MNLIMLGAPGAGKGTIAASLQEILNIPHISTGDIFREYIRSGTELGKLADSYISKGCLVPDDVTIQLVEDRLSQDDCANGFILDGFPRTIKQALGLDNYLKRVGKKITRVVNIVVSEEELVSRLTNRRICKDCKASFNLRILPEGATVCPHCGGELIQREDDNEEVIKKRFATYHEETEPLVEYYLKRRKLAKVRSEHTIEDTFENVLCALKLKGI